MPTSPRTTSLTQPCKKCWKYWSLFSSPPPPPPIPIWNIYSLVLKWLQPSILVTDIPIYGLFVQFWFSFWAMTQNRTLVSSILMTNWIKVSGIYFRAWIPSVATIMTVQTVARYFTSKLFKICKSPYFHTDIPPLIHYHVLNAMSKNLLYLFDKEGIQNLVNSFRLHID